MRDAPPQPARASSSPPLLVAYVGAGRLTPEEAQTISAIIGKRAELFALVELAAEIEALRSQLAVVAGAERPRLPMTVQPH